MSLFKKKITAVVHDGNFHADDVFACAVLLLWAKVNNNRLQIIRSRDNNVIEKADMAVDVGGVYDADKNRFDHHQAGGSGKRENGIPYASLGLVWKKYGEIICGDREIMDRIDKKLVMPIDARDNGVNISITNELGLSDHRTSNMICDFNPTFMESEKPYDEQFKKALSFAGEILNREIAWAKALSYSLEETEKIIKEQGEPNILVLEKDMEWQEAVANNKKIKFVVYPRNENSGWGIQVGRNDLEDYHSNRINLPQNWRGLRDKDLASASGVEDAIFCAPGGWIAAAKTKKGAMQMAEKALQIASN